MRILLHDSSGPLAPLRVAGSTFYVRKMRQGTLAKCASFFSHQPLSNRTENPLGGKQPLAEKTVALTRALA